MNCWKQKILKLRFVENYFREKRGWPILSKGPKGNRILVINAHWDDDIIACFGTLCSVKNKTSLWCASAKNFYLNRPYAELAEKINWENDYDTVFIPAPWDDHPVHQEVSKCWIPDHVEVWAYQSYLPIATNVVVDITSQVQQKVRKLRQMQDLLPNQRNWTHYSLGRDAYASRHLHRKDKRFAELFLVLPGRDYKIFRDEYFRCFPG